MPALRADFNPLTSPIEPCVITSVMFAVLLQGCVNVLLLWGRQFDRALDSDVNECKHSSQRLVDEHVTCGRKGGEGDIETSSVRA